jgi:hypothetical protein
VRVRDLSLLLMMSTLSVFASDPNDKEGCQDHPLFTRMAAHQVGGCETSPFASEELATGPRTTVTVEGRLTKIGCSLNEGAANAEIFASGIRTTGHVAVYGTYFDTNRSDVKPESKPALAEIAKLLKKDPGLELYVVGHTDATGVLDANMKLSRARGASPAPGLRAPASSLPRRASP